MIAGIKDEKKDDVVDIGNVEDNLKACKRVHVKVDAKTVKDKGKYEVLKDGYSKFKETMTKDEEKDAENKFPTRKRFGIFIDRRDKTEDEVTFFQVCYL